MVSEGESNLICVIQQLDEKSAKRHLLDLCLIDREAFGVNAWTEENLLLPLADKFLLSRVALCDGRVSGYVIASRYGSGQAHIHRVVVSGAFRRQGIVTRLLTSLENACSRMGVSELTLESADDRRAANCFYERMKFTRLSGESLAKYLNDRGKVPRAHEYSGSSSQGHIHVYGKMLTY